MSKENSHNPELLGALRDIRALVDQCITLVGRTRRTPTTRKEKPLKKSADTWGNLDFSMPLRPFMKRYAKSVKGGNRKFVLLIAYLAKGQLKHEIHLVEVEKQWNKMTSLLGGEEFNRAYSARAKDNDWVETKKAGIYALRPNWKEIFSNR